jgi:hypothetical protein
MTKITAFLILFSSFSAFASDADRVGRDIKTAILQLQSIEKNILPALQNMTPEEQVKFEKQLIIVKKEIRELTINFGDKSKK